MDDRASSDGAGRRRVGVAVIHGVGETQPGETLASLLEGIGALSGDVKIAPFARVYSRADDDTDGRGSGPNFPIHVRDVALPDGVSARFSELFWADIARVGSGQWHALLGFLRITFEAHHIVDGLLSHETGVLARIYFWLLRIATSWLRGPIAGLSACFIICGLVLVGLGQLGEVAPRLGIGAWLSAHSDFVLMGTLVVLAIFSFALARRWGLDDVWRSDVAVGTGWVAIALVGLTAAQHVWGSAPKDTIEFFERYYPTLRFVWVPWAIAMALAVVFRVLLLPSHIRGAGIALALVFLQSSMWLLLIPGASYILISQIHLLDKLRSAPFTCQSLQRAELYHQELGAVFIVNLAALCVVALTAISVIWRRSALAQREFTSLSAQRNALPRLVVGGRIINAILISSLLILVFLGLILNDAMSELSVGERWARLGALVLPFHYDRLYTSFGGCAAVRLVYGLILWSPVFIGLRWLWAMLYTPVSNYAITSARQIIDHFYRPRLSFAWRISRMETPDHSYRPRRERIERRFARMLQLVYRDEPEPGFDAFVLVAHSQGSVILFEHLLAQINERQPLPREIHIVTIGSPLGAIYNRYSSEYADMQADIGRVCGAVTTWINLFRVHDPIGGPIPAPSGCKIINEMQPAGKYSHMYYWSDSRVVRIVASLIYSGQLPTDDGPPQSDDHSVVQRSDA